MEKLNDAEHINWTARIHKILRKLNMTFPVENIREFCFVLINMFEAVRQDKRDANCSPFHLVWEFQNLDIRNDKKEKAPEGQPPTGAP